MYFFRAGDLGSLIVGRIYGHGIRILKGADDAEVDAEGGQGREEEEAQDVHQNRSPDVAVFALPQRSRFANDREGEVTQLARLAVGHREPSLQTGLVHQTHASHAPTRGYQRLASLTFVADPAKAANAVATSFAPAGGRGRYVDGSCVRLGAWFRGRRRSSRRTYMRQHANRQAR